MNRIGTDNILEVEQYLISDPSDVQTRVRLIEFLADSPDRLDQVRRHVAWLIKNKPDITVPWEEWVIHFLPPEEKNSLKNIWSESLSRNPTSTESLANAARMLVVTNIEFAIDCWRKILRISPSSRKAKESLAYCLFLQSSASEESFDIFKRLLSSEKWPMKILYILSERWESSLFIRSLAAANAYDTNHMKEFEKYVEVFKDELPEVYPEDRFDLYPAYTLLVIFAARNKKEKLVDESIQRLLTNNSFSFSSFVMYDSRMFKGLLDGGFKSQAIKLRDLYLSNNDGPEFRAKMLKLFA